MNNEQNNNIINGVNPIPNLMGNGQNNSQGLQQNQNTVSVPNYVVSPNQGFNNEQSVNNVGNSNLAPLKEFASKTDNLVSNNIEVNSNQDYNNVTIQNDSNYSLNNNIDNDNNTVNEQLNNNIDNQSKDNNISNNDVISVKKYLGLTILFGIPLIGFIMLLIKAFDKKENKNISNYAKAQLLWWLIATVLIGVFVWLMLVIYIGYMGAIKDKIDTPIDNIHIGENNNSSDTSTFNGALYYANKAVLNNIFVYDVPDVFDDESISSSLHYTYGEESIFGDCVFELNSISNYTSAEILINEMIKYYKLQNKEVKKINNIEWYSFEQEDSFGKEYYYATGINNIVYLYQFKINTDDVLDECINYHNSIINSIKLK